jgi:acetyl-CoA C-acetyltransferase
MNKVFILSAVRTPIGGFCGALSPLSATQLGTEVIGAAVREAGISAELVQEVYMGNVLSANLGQSPARQASRFAGLPDTTDCTTVNKVCASGLKAITLGAQAIMTGQADIVVAGGMESMSNVPFYASGVRRGTKLGNTALTDGIIKDGLWDVYNDFHMGSAGELCAKEFGFSREEQDEYAALSYRRALEAMQQHKFDREIIPIAVPGPKGTSTVVQEDEDPHKAQFDKIPRLQPVFDPDGTITAANASNLNDGAAAVVLISERKMQELALAPLARLVGFADAARAPEWFTIAPSDAVTKVLQNTGRTTADIDFYEINEAYACVALANSRLLGIPVKKLNVYGGAVALGHPIGTSGARIMCTLLSVLHQEQGHYGIAAVCNGGGGATAALVERV